jgi:hypothetical protein
MNQHPDLADLTEAINLHGLGPATVTLEQTSWGEDMAVVLLDTDAPDKAGALAMWLEFITVRDAVAGRLRRGDPRMRLHLRGWFPSGLPVVVSAPYDARTEPVSVTLIDTRIDTQDIPRLLAALSLLDERGHR